MPLTPGTRVGPYEILSPLGVGGMGEVYRARDARLQRDVALKVLAGGVTPDAASLARFEQEARATAALNHPNIVAVYDVGTHDGQPFLVSELLEGQTLRDALRAGPLPVRKALDFAAQIAIGLGAAHDKAIVHRDLKPENIFTATDGRAKILDFGIAKLLAPPDNNAALATAAAPRTDAGTVLGTAGYMSPEQIRGGAVDHRTDIFALGAMLFEMLSGSRPFAAATNADSISAVLSRDPVELVTPDGSAPPAIDRLVRRCLEKAPEQRFQSARDLAFALEAITLGTGRASSAAAAVVPATRSAPRGREIAAWAAAALLAAVAGVALLRPRPEIPLPSPARFNLDIPFGVEGTGASLAVSPDGKSLAVRSLGGVYVRRLDGENFVTLPNSPGTPGTGGSVWWSADNQSIVFQQKGELREIGVAASESRLIARLPPEATVNAVAWGAQGAVLVALNSSPLHIVRAGSATLEPVAPLDTAAGELEQLGPIFLPDGRRYLYSSVRSGANRYVTRLRSLDTDAVQDFAGIDERVIWADDNQVVLTSGTALLAQAVSYNPPSLVGSPVQLASNVGLNPGARSSQAAVSGSTLVYRSGRVVARQFTWLARDGHSLGPLGPAGAYTTFSLSDDGARVVLTRIEGGARNIWVMDAAKGTLNRVTAGPDVDLDPRLSPDGRTVMFGSFRDPVRSPYTAAVAGSEPKRLFGFKGRLFALDDWSADGKWLLYHDSSMPPILAARLDQLAAEPVVAAAALTGFVDQAIMSNDGRWVAYNSTESGQAEVYVVPFPPTGDKWQVSVGGGAQPLWRRDGGELYYLKLDGTLMAVGISTRPKFEAANPTALFRTPLSNVAQVVEQYAVAPDGKRFLFAQALGDATAVPMTVLTNWRTLLKPSGPTQ